MITVPTFFTLMRFFMAPGIVHAIGLQQWWLATFFFVVASLTDALDGFLARLLHQESRFGSYIDPLADKCLMVSCYYALAQMQVIPLWFLWGICLKEFVLLIAAGLFAVWHSIPVVPLWLGKSAMVAQVVFVFLALLASALSNSAVHVPLWLSIGVFVLAILPLVHYAMTFSWRYI